MVAQQVGGFGGLILPSQVRDINFFKEFVRSVKESMSNVKRKQKATIPSKPKNISFASPEQHLQRGLRAGGLNLSVTTPLILKKDLIWGIKFFEMKIGAEIFGGMPKMKSVLSAIWQAGGLLSELKSRSSYQDFLATLNRMNPRIPRRMVYRWMAFARTYQTAKDLKKVEGTHEAYRILGFTKTVYQRKQEQILKKS